MWSTKFGSRYRRSARNVGRASSPHVCLAGPTLLYGSDAQCVSVALLVDGIRVSEGVAAGPVEQTLASCSQKTNSGGIEGPLRINCEVFNDISTSLHKSMSASSSSAFLLCRAARAEGSQCARLQMALKIAQVISS